MSLQSNNNLIGIPTKRYNKSSNYTNILSTLPIVRIDRSQDQIRRRCGFDTHVANSESKIPSTSWIRASRRRRRVTDCIDNRRYIWYQTQIEGRVPRRHRGVGYRVDQRGVQDVDSSRRASEASVWLRPLQSDMLRQKSNLAPYSKIGLSCDASHQFPVARIEI